MTIPRLGPNDAMEFLEMTDDRRGRMKEGMRAVIEILRDKVRGPLEAYAVLDLCCQYLRETHHIKSATRVMDDQAGNS